MAGRVFLHRWCQYNATILRERAAWRERAADDWAVQSWRLTGNGRQRLTRAAMRDGTQQRVAIAVAGPRE